MAQLNVNGRNYDVQVEPDTPLLWVIREQVGLTGTRISPELYIACGISGAIQHLVGCKGAKRILVINKDPEAAFFAKADYGVLGDLHEVLPAIIEEVKKQTA